MKRKITTIKTIPFQGGCSTAVEPALLDGKPSMVQNFRQKHPGYVKRQGQIKQHSTADSTNKVLSMYQFVKGKKTERHFYAQMSDDDVLEATTAPPGVTTGAFGSEVFSGAASSLPASWANVNDFLLFANGVDRIQIYPGTGLFVDAFYVYKGSFDPLTISNVFSGIDYGVEVSDNNAATYADVSSLKTLAETLGDELVTNGTFASDASWTKNGTTIAGGVADFPGGSQSTKTISQTIVTTVGKQYKLSLNIGVDGVTELIYCSSGDTNNWLRDDVLTGQSSNAHCHLFGYEGAIYWSMNGREGNYTLDEILSDGTYPIDQTATYPIIVDASSSQMTALGSTFNSSGVQTSYYTAIGASTTLTIQKGLYPHNTVDDVSVKECNYHCIFIKSPLPVQTLGFTMSSVNGTASVAAVKYWDGDSFADAAGFADGTSASSKVFAQSGSMTWTAPSDEKPLYLYGQVGYWYMIYLSSGTLDSETRISAVTYESAWQSIINMWDGVWVDVIEAQKYTGTSGIYTTYGAEAITLNAFTTTDALYFSSYDDIENIKADVLTPNATGDTLSFERWNGASWDTVTITDGTAGFSKSGRITFTRGTSVKQDFNNLGYMAHWYKITTGSAFAAAVVIALSVQPYFDITEIGKGQTVAAWKNRAVYGTDQDHYCYLTSADGPQILNGDESTILAPGDGRYNRPVCIRNFNDDLLIFQEEKGKDGGCITKYSWLTTVDDIKKHVISTTLGTMNVKSVDVVDGVEFAELNRDIPIMSLTFFLSRSGVYVTDGSSCYMISQDIANYFDPTNSACIKIGTESQMWLKYDSAYGVIRIGLVSGSSGTVPNVFPVYAVKDKTWSFDVLTQPLSCMTEAEAGSGAVTVIQLGGGTADGTVYVLNSGTNDVSTAIDSYVTAELDGKGEILHMNELLLRAKAQTGNITVTPSLNSIAQTALTVSQAAEIATQTIRRHRQPVNLVGQHISLKIQHNTVSESCQLLDIGTAMEVYEEQ